MRTSVRVRGLQSWGKHTHFWTAPLRTSPGSHSEDLKDLLTALVEREEELSL